MVPELDLARLQIKDRAQIEALAARLEAAWQAAGPGTAAVPLDSFLPAPGDALRAIALCELIKVDLDHRCRRGQGIDLEQYLNQFPELGTPASVAAELIRDEYTVRQRHGQAPAVEDYRARFPARFADFERLIGGDAFGTQVPSQVLTPPLAALAPAAPRAGSSAPTVSKPALSGGAADADRVLRQAGYRLLNRLGKGAFGEVWRAEAPGRIAAAVKIIHRSLQHELAQRELQALDIIKEIRHPFLLQTHAYWSMEDQLLIAMDLADGTLTDRLKQCRDEGLPGIPAPELLKIFREAAEGLDFLQKNNVLHRDIKPANILLLAGHAKVADFGLAKLQDAAASMTTLGTPNYMAPEVWQSKLHPASDQYALACSYGEMRLGRLPFTSAKDMVTAMSAHLWEEPDLTGLPEAEQQVLRRALNKNPEERYPSCLAFVAALEEALAPLFPPGPGGGDPTFRGQGADTAHVGGRETATAIPARQTRAFWVLLLGVLVLVPAFLAVLVWHPWQPTPPTAPAPEVDWLPDGVEKAEAAQIVTVDGKRLYDRVVRVKGEQRVVFLLIPREKETDPATFYLMEDKVSNDLYRAAVADPSFQEHLAEFAQKQPATVRNEWEKGGIAADKDVGAADGRLPVLRVTVTEAHCFARWLGGNLPALLQWDKAAGRLNDAKAPFKDPETPLAPGDVAVGRAAEGPMPVGTAARDISPFGCRDMAGNGKEWTRNMDDGGSLVPVPEPKEDLLVIVRGREYFKPRPLFFADRVDHELYFEAKPALGFRVALNLGLSP